MKFFYLTIEQKNFHTVSVLIHVSYNTVYADVENFIQ